jgi:hypothetical protein
LMTKIMFEFEINGPNLSSIDLTDKFSELVNRSQLTIEIHFWWLGNGVDQRSWFIGRV